MGPVGQRGGWFFCLFFLIVLVWSFLFLLFWNCLVCLLVRFKKVLSEFGDVYEFSWLPSLTSVSP